MSKAFSFSKLLLRRPMPQFRAIPNAAPKDRFAAVHVCGNSLQNFGILDGDILVFKFADFWQSAYRHQLSV